MTRVRISGKVVQWARERSGMPLDALEDRFPRVSEWESGDAEPTLRQLEKYSRATMTPLGYFFLNEPPEEQLPIPSFRTVGDGPPGRPSPNLLDTVFAMQRRQSWMREYLQERGSVGLPFVGSATGRDAVSVVADDMHVVLGLPVGWAASATSWAEALNRLRFACEAAGILVVFNGVVGNNSHRKLDPSEFRGFVLTDKLAPLVFVNNADFKSAQMFTLAHEIAHLWLGKSAAFDLRRLEPANDPTERLCNRIAAEFLLPEAQLREAWTSAKNEAEPFQVLARRFKVSTIVAARRALDAGLITQAQFFEFYDAYAVDERRSAAGRDSGGGDSYNNYGVRIGRPFAEAVVHSAQEGRLLYRDAYELLGIRGATFDEFARRMGLMAR